MQDAEHCAFQCVRGPRGSLTVQGTGLLLGTAHRVDWHEGFARLRAVPTTWHRFHPALQSLLVAHNLPRDFWGI
eukprot:6036770-Lingulodinium_polyedra.AAC.1